jgi:hypothetical protein
MASDLPKTERVTDEQEQRKRRGLYRPVEAAMASCGYWDVSVHREREGRRVRERSRRRSHGDGRCDWLGRTHDGRSAATVEQT